MRRLYPDLLLRRVTRGDYGFPLRVLRAAWAARRGKALPILGTLIVTYRCDLRCAMCDLPARGDRGRELDTEGFKGVLDAFRDLGTLGVGVTGGEPLLRRDLLDILAHGTGRGLLMHLNTNGSLVDEEFARGLAHTGVVSVNLSLDGPDAETHDRLRRREGSFERVLRAAARLGAVEKRPFRIALTCALGAGNADLAPAMLDRARDLGVDRVGFLPVHDFPSNRIEGTNGRPLRLPVDDPLLDNSAEYLALFGRAFDGERNPIPCLAPRTSLVVDCYGEVYPCVPLNAARKGRLRPEGGDLRALWRSEAYRRLRDELKGCRDCYWNCHTELNLTLRKLGSRP
ncbi:MAG: radical SAM protein [Planctomycetota bacterium]